MLGGLHLFFSTGSASQALCALVRMLVGGKQHKLQLHLPEYLKNNSKPYPIQPQMAGINHQTQET